MTKVFNINGIDMDNIYYCKPKKIGNSEYIDILYNKEPFVLKLPYLDYSKMDDKNFDIILNDASYNFFKILDKQIIKDYKNSKYEWINMNELSYSTIIRKNKNDNIVKCCIYKNGYFETIVLSNNKIINYIEQSDKKIRLIIEILHLKKTEGKMKLFMRIHNIKIKC